MVGAKRMIKWIGAAALFGLAIGFVLTPQQAASKSPQSATPQQPAADDAVPAYHTQPPQDELPATMNPDLFAEPLVQNAYAVAAKIKKVLYQQPCYCHISNRWQRDKDSCHTASLTVH